MPSPQPPPSSGNDLTWLRRVMLYMVSLRQRRFHGEVTYKYFDGRVTQITTLQSDKPDTLVVPEGEALDRAIDTLFHG